MRTILKDEGLMTIKYIAYQGEPGAFSDAACQRFAPDMEPLPCATFDRVFDAVATGKAKAAMVPIENAIAGRVDDVYRLLPDMPMSIVAEHFLPIEMQLMTLPGADSEKLATVRSHPMALGQCRTMINRRGLLAQSAGDTAGAARGVSEAKEMTVAAIAPEVAAERYGLEIIERNVQDADRNFTRFFTLMPEDQVAWPDLLAGPILTS
ncbi:MAG: prephenate dehydratase domain-containing protein, partial [Pseudomonadota bacterium]